jgi:preprotein translocase subunit YajC
MQNGAMNATILQIIFLVVYGIFWILFMKSQKRNGSENY